MKDYLIALTIIATAAVGASSAFAQARRVVSKDQIPQSGFYSQCNPGQGCTRKGYPFARYRGTPGPRANFYRNIDIR
jgi:hypothetical protein